MNKWLMTLLAGLMLCTSALAAIDLNTATQSELETVKGIGPAKAKDIVEYRQKNGAFKNGKSTGWNATMVGGVLLAGTASR